MVVRYTLATETLITFGSGVL
ncbi:protein of unknown function [Thermococcus camini]|uniref:Uncharacterized protein n=1 Tax=Thermococcus camini TaxID=2016373 RepID=A0A7G2D5H0_9EURY|nr:protein of unknown function [Thermococcus camini]